MSLVRQVTIASLLLIAGCLPSLHGVYTDEDLVFEPGIVGFWQLENSSQTWDFKKRDEKSFDLVFTDKLGQSGRFVAHLCRVEDTLFLDLFPWDEDADATAFYKYHLLPIHTVYMVKQTKPSLELVSMDLNWLKQHLADHPDDLSHSTYNKRTLITASTKELQKFLVARKDRFTGSFKLNPVGQN
jgi:hypothetical protein